MKKLMVMLAVAAMGFCANAAEVDWAQWCVTLSSAEYGYACFGFVADDYSGIISSLENGTFTGSGAVGNAEWNDPPDYRVGTDGEISLSAYPSKGLFVVFDSTDISTAGNYATLQLNFDGRDGYFDHSDPWAGGVPTEAWKTYGSDPIPEPTSGLLLLLGAAGLALRRKRI